MNNLSTDQLVESRSNTDVSTSPRTILIVTAWVATLLLSKLPLVIARDILGTDIPWITPAWIGMAILLFTATYIWQRLRPLRAYFLVMGVIWILAGFDPLVRQTAVWQNLFARQSEMVTLLGDRVLLVLYSFIVIATLFLMGAKRRDVFLVVGNLKAPVGGETSSPGRRSLSWSVLGTGMAVLLGGSFFAFLVSQIPAGLSNIAFVVPWLPLILLSAALNAFAEEVTYRAAPLGMLLPVVGPKHALWLTSLWFGLGHYYGGFPSGPAGLVQSGLLALLMGKAMLDTRGLGWPWIIHVAVDTAIYTFIALTTVAML
jgi:membrane protease YdiL (CAAX protease family)